MYVCLYFFMRFLPFDYARYFSTQKYGNENYQDNCANKQQSLENRCAAFSEKVQKQIYTNKTDTESDNPNYHCSKKFNQFNNDPDCKKYQNNIN